MKTTVFAGRKVLWAVLVGALAPWAGGCAPAGDEGREGAALDEPQSAVGEARLVNGVTAQNDAPASIKKFGGFNYEADAGADGGPSFVKKFQGPDQEADAVANGGASFVKKFDGFNQEADVVANGGASFVKKFSGFDHEGEIVANDLLGPNMKDTVARGAPVVRPEGDAGAADLGPDNLQQKH